VISQVTVWRAKIAFAVKEVPALKASTEGVRQPFNDLFDPAWVEHFDDEFFSHLL
jgi:hypothetical protein